MNLKKLECTPNPKGIISSRRELLTQLQVEVEINMLRVSSETQKYKNKKFYTFPVHEDSENKDKKINFYSFESVLVDLVKKDEKPLSFLFSLKVIDIIYNENTLNKIISTQSFGVLFYFYDASPAYRNITEIEFDGDSLSILLNDGESLFFSSKENYVECQEFIESVQRELFSTIKK